MISAQLNTKKEQAFASSTAQVTMHTPYVHPEEIHWELDCHVKNMWFWLLQVKKKAMVVHMFLCIFGFIKANIN